MIMLLGYATIIICRGACTILCDRGRIILGVGKVGGVRCQLFLGIVAARNEH